MVLVHDDGNVRPFFNGCFQEMPHKVRASVLPGAGRSLHDRWAVGCIGGFHDRAHLLQIVDVESRDPVIVLGSMVEQLP